VTTRDVTIADERGGDKWGQLEAEVTTRDVTTAERTDLQFVVCLKYRWIAEMKKRGHVDRIEGMSPASQQYSTSS
jgi:hypothetical protein